MTSPPIEGILKTMENSPYFSHAQTPDLQEISKLVNSAYRGESSKKGWTTEADFLDGQRTDPKSLAEELSDPNTTILCLRAQENSPILACVFLKRFEDEQGIGCYLGMFTVEPTLQAQGLGRVLHAKALEVAKEWGAVRMSLGVIHLRHSLMAWYERLGYQKTGATEAFPYENPKCGLPKVNDLHFVMFEKSL